MENERDIKFKLTVFGILGIVYLSIGVCFVLGAIGCLFIPDKEARLVVVLSLFPMGLFWLVLGGVFLALELSKRKKMRNAFLNGRKVFAEYMYSKRNMYVKKAGFRPLNVYCMWVDESNRKHIFKSADLDFDPDVLLQGKMIPVYVNPENYSEYYVDLDCVLPLEEMHSHIL